MDITLEMVDQVRERTGVTYEAAKNALEACNGNIVDAIIRIEKKEEENSVDVVEKIKSAVEKGNVNRIRVLRGEEELVNIPVNAGIVGGVLGIVAGPWVLISAAVAGAVAKFGFSCRFQIVKEDGSVVELTRTPDEDTECAEDASKEQPAAEEDVPVEASEEFEQTEE